MARRSVPGRPVDRDLSSSEIRHAIERLEQRITDLKVLDPNSISDYRSPTITGLETSIEDTLAGIFGHDTPRFNRYRPAADLEPAPVLTMTPDWVAARSGGRGGRSMPDVQELREGIVERKDRAIAMLEQAVRGLAEMLPTPSLDDLVAAPRSFTPQPAKNSVFLVHGHDAGVLQAVARFLELLSLEVIVLAEQPDEGRTIIEKFEHYAEQVGFAVILLTPDDVAGTADAPGSALRARQNVIFELGYFAGKLGRGRACLLKKGDIEIPSDLFGVIYKEFDAGDGWKLQLVKELKAAQLDFDANRVFS